MRICGAGAWGMPADAQAARQVLRRAVDLGVTLIDTADCYGPEVSETLISESLHPYPEGVVIATKGGLTRPGPGRWAANGRPDYLRSACDASLKRLKLDRIDLYQFHAPDPSVPYEESIGALAELQAQGKIRHIGVSNVGLDQLRCAQRVAPIVSVQNRYNLSNRSSEDVLQHCAREAIGFLPWYPLDSGRSVSGGTELDRIARRYRATPAQVAIAWLLQKSPVMLPIPGTSSVAHLEENVGAGQLVLSAGDLDALA
jgi:aryl-alcohol dehydrogenase-like predicted oxidoreductase